MRGRGRLTAFVLDILEYEGVDDSYLRHGSTVSLRWRDADHQQHGGKYAVRRIAFWPWCPHDVDTDRWSLSPGRVNERGQAMNVLADMIRTKGTRSELTLRNTEGEVQVRKVIPRGRFRPPVRTALSAVITLGACSALLTTGLVFVSASPASAAQAAKLVFATQPHRTAIAGESIATFVVLVEDGFNARATTNLRDSITISSSCVLSGTTVATASDGAATFGALAIVSVGLCTLTATDTSTHMATNTRDPSS